MITFEGVTYSYPGATDPVFQDVNLSLPEGEFVLVVGPSGVGKSTLLRCFNGLVPHFSGGKLSGRITVDGLDPVAATPKVMSQHVGFVFQDPEAQFVMDQVEDEIAFALENAALPRQEMRVRVEEVLDLLDLAPLRERRLETLSGGEKQRVAIASALALRPKVLVLDEPTSQLDPKSAEDVLHSLTRLNADMGLTIVMAEHRLERVLPFADSLIYIPEDGGQVLYGFPEEILAHIDLVPPLVALGKALGWSPLPLTIKAGRRFSRRLPIASLMPVKKPKADFLGQPCFSVEGLEVAYGSKPVLRGLDFEVHPGEIMALIGRNGTGKTTLLKSLVGLVHPNRGQVRVLGQDIAGMEVADVCRKIGYLPQDPNALLFADTVMDELRITLRNHGLTEANAPIPLDALLACLGLTDKAQAYPRDLSVGERQRVALGAVMVTRPSALLLDEPTRGLDYVAKQRLFELLRGWRDQGMAVLLVTHDVELVAAVADRVMVLSQGEVIARGDPAEVLGTSPLFAPQVARLFPNTGLLTVAEVLPALEIAAVA